MHKKGQQKPVIAYGSAQFPSNGKGELSVPTVYIKNKAKNFYKVVEVSEWRTSKICPVCDTALQKVYQKSKEDEKYYQVRGLLRCGSKSCKKISFKDRDSVGARNILRCHVVKPRPESLTYRREKKALVHEKFYLRDEVVAKKIDN